MDDDVTDEDLAHMLSLSACLAHLWRSIGDLQERMQARQTALDAASLEIARISDRIADAESMVQDPAPDA